MLDFDTNRLRALEIAFDEHVRMGECKAQPGVDRAETTRRFEDAVRTSAEVWLAWLRGPVTMQVEWGRVVDQITKLPTGNVIQPGGKMAQIRDNEEVDFTINPKDGKGFPSKDALIYAVDDPAVISVVGATDEDTHTGTIVGGDPGVTMLRVTDPTSIDPTTGETRSWAANVEVVAGDAVSADFAWGAPRLQTPATTEPAPEPTEPGTGDDTTSTDDGTVTTGE